MKKDKGSFVQFIFQENESGHLNLKKNFFVHQKKIPMSVLQHRKAFTFFAHLLSAFLLSSFSGFSSAKNYISVNVDQQTGNYSISSNTLHWRFKGTIGQKLSQLKSSKGHDAIGNFQPIFFTWKNKNDYAATIRWYDEKPVVIFSLSLPNGAENPVVSFPDFDEVPSSYTCLQKRWCVGKT